MKSSVIRQALVARPLVKGTCLALLKGALLILSSTGGGHATPAGTMRIAPPDQQQHTEDEV